jgi:hypothetical protein
MSVQVNEAMQAIHEGEWQRAEQLARERLEDAPEDPDWLTPLAVALQMQRRWEEQLEVIAEALEDDEGLTNAFEDGARLRAMRIRAATELDLIGQEAEKRLVRSGWGFWTKELINPGPVEGYARVFSDMADLTDRPEWEWLGELDPEPVPADALTDKDVATLQRIIDEDSYFCSELTCGEDLQWLLATVVPGDSRRALAMTLEALRQDAFSVVVMKTMDENIGRPLARALHVAGMTATASAVSNFGQEISDLYMEQIDEARYERRDSAEAIVEVFDRAGLGLAREPESVVKAFFDEVDKASTWANIGDPQVDGIQVVIEHRWKHSPYLAFSGPIAEMWPHQPRWNDYFDFSENITGPDDHYGRFQVPLTDVKKELRRFVKRLGPLVEQYRDDSSGVHHVALRVMGKAGPPVPDSQAALPLDGDD